MMDVLEGKSVVITGAARGIGLATAKLFASHSARLLLVDLDEEDLQLAVEACNQFGADALGIARDITAREAGTRIVDEAVRTYGCVDGLINNAGIEFRGSLQEHSDEAWDKVIEVNLTAAFSLCRAAAPELARARGAIVNVASVAIAGFPGQCAYDASKGGLASLTRSLCTELGPKGVRVNSVAPGFIATEMVATHPDLKKVADKFTKSLPIARAGQPEEVANAIAWLASENASYVTGHTLYVDGGWIRA
ncbi:MAG: SDR family NAD(P)-dependent oxidoreductase [Pseudomonadota bacterium]